MGFRGVFDIPGHGLVNVYDTDKDVPRAMIGRKVGIVEDTASFDLTTRGNSVLPGSVPWGMLIKLAIAIVILLALTVILAIVNSLTKVDVDEFDTDGDGIPDMFVIKGPGWATTVDDEGNIISQDGEPFFGGISGIVTPIIIGVVAIAALFVTFQFILPALSKKKG